MNEFFEDKNIQNLEKKINLNLKRNQCCDFSLEVMIPRKNNGVHSPAFYNPVTFSGYSSENERN